MKKKSLKKLSLNKLHISKLTISDTIVGGSGNHICWPESEPFNVCPPPPTCFRTRCDSCNTNQVNGC